MKRSRTLECLGVLALLVVAAFLRYYPNNSGIPSFVFPRQDEVHYVPRVMGFYAGVWGNRDFINPSLYLYLLYGVTWLGGGLLVLGGRHESLAEFCVETSVEPYFVAIVGRMISITLSVGSVLLLYLIARRMFSWRVAFVAAAALAVNVTHVDRAILAGTESTMVFLVLAFFLAVLRYVEEPTVRKHVICGLILGLAASTKYNAGIHAIVLVAASLLGARACGGVRDQLRERRFWAGFPVLIAAFLAASPLIAFKAREFWARFSLTASGIFEGFKVGPAHELGWTYYVTSFPKANNELSYALLCAAGLGIASYRVVRRGDSRAVLLLTAAVPLYLFYGPGQSSQMRYFQPAIPFVLVFGALALDSLVSLLLSRVRGQAGRVVRVLLTFFLAFLLLASGARRIHAGMNRRYGRPDDRGEHAVWLEENLDARVYVAFGNLDSYQTFEHYRLLAKRHRLSWRPRPYFLRLRFLIGLSPTLEDFIRKLEDLECKNLLFYLSANSSGSETLDVDRVLAELRKSMKGCEYRTELIQYLSRLDRTRILSTRSERIVWCAFRLP